MNLSAGAEEQTHILCSHEKVQHYLLINAHLYILFVKSDDMWLNGPDKYCPPFNIQSRQIWHLNLDFYLIFWNRHCFMRDSGINAKSYSLASSTQAQKQHKAQTLHQSSLKERLHYRKADSKIHLDIVTYFDNPVQPIWAIMLTFSSRPNNFMELQSRINYVPSAFFLHVSESKERNLHG